MKYISENVNNHLSLLFLTDGITFVVDVGFDISETKVAHVGQLCLGGGRG